jgi:hypothetical protein
MPNPIAATPEAATTTPNTNNTTDIRLRPTRQRYARQQPGCHGYQRILALFRAGRNNYYGTPAGNFYIA